MGEVGSFIVFENEKVIIWEMVLEPGQQTTCHIHMPTIFFMCLKAPRWRYLINKMIFCLLSNQTREMLSHSLVGMVSFSQVMAKAYR